MVMLVFGQLFLYTGISERCLNTLQYRYVKKNENTLDTFHIKSYVITISENNYKK